MKDCLSDGPKPSTLHLAEGWWLGYFTSLGIGVTSVNAEQILVGAHRLSIVYRQRVSKRDKAP